MERPAIFVDKDGTLVENYPYNVNPALLRFMDGALEALGALALGGYALVVVTNQSGIGRGFFTREQFALLQAELLRRIWDEAGIRFDDFLVCPHSPGRDGRPACLCRKPAPGLLTRAARRHGLDLRRSWIVGDTLDDVEAGHRAGCRGLLLDSGGETVWRRSPLREPEGVCGSWAEVARTVLGAPQRPPLTADQDSAYSFRRL
ncbi:D-glycero-alpha-D-manno-heptose-1,7-bisphosphate 7-phosphatase [Roseateles violae]|uniref:D,D-heptose 1,7-bisphosphate phosphatase n=1 Tax=Roseateles violae TaxID=3058042 RepID=A0ABT8DVN8_9BURK|nr:HAD-IIIA family hydrolase [Pelomonas sp. PFR6]MDN3922332.1 HAD-IIIA family hydrolase [Pelomonas sp. PFR6]